MNMQNKDTVFKYWPFWWCLWFTAARFISCCFSLASGLWWLRQTLSACHSAPTQMYN